MISQRSIIDHTGGFESSKRGTVVAQRARIVGALSLAGLALLARRNRREIWKWLADRVQPHIPARYGVTISGCSFWGDEGGPPIKVEKDRLSVRGDLWERPAA